MPTLDPALLNTLNFFAPVPRQLHPELLEHRLRLELAVSCTHESNK
jgi:hypothetical protein